MLVTRALVGCACIVTLLLVVATTPCWSAFLVHLPAESYISLITTIRFTTDMPCSRTCCILIFTTSHALLLPVPVITTCREGTLVSFLPYRSALFFY